MEKVRDSHCRLKLGDTRALFAGDRHAPTEGDFEQDLRWMAYNRRTVRNVLRRALWNEQFHIEEIRRHLEGRSGDRAPVGTA